MLLQLILTLTVMAVHALTVPLQNTSMANQLLYERTHVINPLNLNMPHTDKDNTYTTQQMEQFYQGHVDTLRMCSDVVQEAADNPTRFDRIFREYFDPADRDLVIRVFKTLLDYDGSKRGSPNFDKVDVVDDFPPAYNFNLDWHCNGPLGNTVAETAQKDKLRPRDELILCPPFFIFGSFEEGPDKDWPTVLCLPRCSNIGNRLNELMNVMATTLLHEYTHWIDAVEHVLGQRTVDKKYGFYNTRKMDKEEAKMNADSYAHFATELTWSKLCDRDFDPPEKPK